MNREQLTARLESLCPGTQVELRDLTGTADHWQATVVSSAFEGKPLVERHRMVFALVNAEVQSNEVHALTLKTFTPSERNARK